MVGSKKKENVFAKGGVTVFDRALEVEGNIKFGGKLEILGKVNGSIFAEDSSNAEVHIHDSGEIYGEISAPNMIINGRVNGDVYSSKHVELGASAVVDGNLHYKIMEMVKGAQINGNLVYVSDSEQKEGKQDEESLDKQ